MIQLLHLHGLDIQTEIECSCLINKKQNCTH